MISGKQCKHLDSVTGLCREVPRHWSAETMRIAKGQWKCALVKDKGECFHYLPTILPRKPENLKKPLDNQRNVSYTESGREQNTLTERKKMSRPRTKVASNTVRSIVSKYTRGAGLVALAEEFELSASVIRRVLVDNDVPIRGRGRPAGTTAAK